MISSLVLGGREKFMDRLRQDRLPVVSLFFARIKESNIYELAKNQIEFGNQ